jgi:peptidoglycan hydrolase-like protein with peptidoglycan-binding domain
MKTIVKLLLIAAVFPLFTVAGAAQTATIEETPAQWKITEKEVIAVQTELKRRGYYNAKPTGVLDRNTREAVKEYQSDNQLKATGRIDRPTYEKLGLRYPATGKEGNNERRSGVLPSIGYGVKDTATSTSQAVTGAANKVKDTTKSGYDKTKGAGDAAVSKSKETAESLGDSTKKGAQKVSQGTQRASDALVGRSDAEIQTDVREVLSESPGAEKWYSDVKNGVVTVKTPAQHNVDVGAVISNIRKVSGVKSVFVIAE